MRAETSRPEDLFLAGASTGHSARGRAGADGVLARFEFGASLVGAVLPRVGSGPVRSLFRRGAALGDAGGGGLVFLARPLADGPRVLTVVLAPGPRQRRRPAHGLPHHRLHLAGGAYRVP